MEFGLFAVTKVASLELERIDREADWPQAPGEARVQWCRKMAGAEG